jgi:hypothetical protein
MGVVALVGAVIETIINFVCALCICFYLFIPRQTERGGRGLKWKLSAFCQHVARHSYSCGHAL